MSRITASRETTKNLDGYGFAAARVEARVTDSLDKTSELETTRRRRPVLARHDRPDGRPHVMPVGIVWSDGSSTYVRRGNAEVARTWPAIRIA